MNPDIRYEERKRTPAHELPVGDAVSLHYPAVTPLPHNRRCVQLNETAFFFPTCALTPPAILVSVSPCPKALYAMEIPALGAYQRPFFGYSTKNIITQNP